MQRLSLATLFGLGAVLAACHLSNQPVDGSGNPLAADGKVACGQNTCSNGEVCCNASCGICTPQGGSCIQLACESNASGKTCADTKCAEGELCSDLGGRAVCVPQEENPCNLIDCAPNAICEVQGGQAVCVPVSSDAGRDPGQIGACAAALCPVDTTCDDSSGTAKCVKGPTCSGIKCEAGQHCELQEVQCIRAPCPPIPTCVPDVSDDPCATVRCAAGTHCEAKEVQCIQAPCPPVAECVPDSSGIKCGKNTCGAGQYCCDALCGKCAPKGAFCTQGCAAGGQ